jgi:glyoxylase-like metal-dependent hydrolase (beta-lactamase superfamily II)
VTSDQAGVRLGHGVGKITLPLPFPSPPSVNAYVLDTDEGLLLLDCGVAWEPGRSTLEKGLADLGRTLGEVTVLVVTHLHPDHVGMAPRLVEETGCRLVMHRRAATLYERYNDTPGLVERTRLLARRHGVPPDLVDAVADLGPRPDWMPPLRPPDGLLDDGDRIPLGGGRTLEVLHTPGHEAAHICLRDSRTGILFAGDHVLPRITPVVMYDEALDDPLGEYMGSLQRLVDLRVGLTYPAHGTVVERGSQRAIQILLHHRRRLAGMEEVLARGPATAWRVMEEVYRPHLTPPEQRLALRETVAHLEHLRGAGRVTSFEDDGVVFYRLAF